MSTTATTLTWTRRKSEPVTYHMGGLPQTVQHAEHAAKMPDSREFALRSVEGSFFLYVDGKQHEARHFWNTLRDGKAAVQRAADAMTKAAEKAAKA